MTEMLYYKPWLLFRVCEALTFGYLLYFLWSLIQSWSRGQSRPSGSGWTFKAVRIWLAEVLFQRQFLGLSFSRWIVHMLIFWGFLCLSALSLFIFFVGLHSGLRDYFIHGNGHFFIKVWGDGFGLSLLAGLLAASFRRIVLRSRQLVNDQSDVILLAFLIWLTLSGFFLEGLRLSHASSEALRYSFVGRFFVLPWAVNRQDAGLWLTALWSIHAFSGLGLLIYLPNSKLMHSLLGPVVIAMNASEEQERKDIYWPTIKGHRPIK